MYYDLFYGKKDYQAETAYVVSHIQQHCSQAKTILELGCGTGIHAIELVRSGYGVTGVDISESMLSAARTKRHSLPMREQTKLNFLQADVRSLVLDNRFDAAVALFHVLNYQRSNTDLMATFSTVARHLRAGGVFMFDFWYGPSVLTQRPETRVTELDNDEATFTRIARPSLRENDNCVEVELIVIREEKETRIATHVKETHVMRYLFMPEIDMFLEHCGMQRICATSWMSGDTLNDSSWSGFVVARKAD